MRAEVETDVEGRVKGSRQWEMGIEVIVIVVAIVLPNKL